jgi:hypothetical protein
MQKKKIRNRNGEGDARPAKTTKANKVEKVKSQVESGEAVSFQLTTLSVDQGWRRVENATEIPKDPAEP